MAIDPNAFSLDANNDAASQGPNRQQKMRALLGSRASLGTLFNGVDDNTSDLSKSSLNGGQTTGPLATPGIGTAPGTPSLTSTERVPQVPNFAASTPLLTGEQQAGAELGEAQRGEEGVIGGGPGRQGLSTADRNRALMSFFRPSSSPDQSSQSNDSTQPSDTMKAVGSARSAVGAAGRASSLLAVPKTADFQQVEGNPFGGISTVESAPAGSRGSVPTADPDFNPEKGSSFLDRFQTPDFTAANVGTGVGLLGSLAGLIGTAANNPNLAKAGSGLGIAGQGVKFGASPDVAGGAGLLGAGLGLAGSLTGNRDVGLAGHGLSLGSNLYSLGSTLAGAAGTTPTAGAAAAGAGASAGEAAGAGAAAAGAGVGGESLGSLGLSGLLGGAGFAFAPATLGYAGMNIADSIETANRVKRDVANARNVLGAKVPSALSRLSKTLSGVSNLDPSTASTDELMSAQQQLQAARGEFNAVDHAFKGALTINGKSVNTGLSLNQVKPQIDDLNTAQLAIQDELERRGLSGGQIPGYQSPVAWTNAFNPDAFRATTGRVGYESDGETPVALSLQGADANPAAYANYARDPGYYGIDPNDPTLSLYRQLSASKPGTTRATLASLFGQ